MTNEAHQVSVKTKAETKTDQPAQASNQPNTPPEDKPIPAVKKTQNNQPKATKRRRPRSRKKKVKTGNGEVGRPGSLILPRAKDQGIVITLMAGIDRTQPIGNLLSEGLELRLLDIQEDKQFGQSAVLSIFGSNIFHVRRDKLLDHPVQREYSKLISLVANWAPQTNYMDSLKELREQRVMLTDALRQIEMDLGKLKAAGAGYMNNKHHHSYVAFREEKNEILFQRDVVDMRIQNIENENDVAFRSSQGQYAIKWHKRIEKAVQKEIGEERFYAITQAVDEQLSHEAEKSETSEFVEEVA